MKLRLIASALVLGSLLLGGAAHGATPALTAETAAELAVGMPRAELAGQSIYFVMPDRYANGSTANDQGDDGPLTSGAFAPQDPGYFHGGDLIGLRQHLGRIHDMGFTALWITPVVVNRAEQGSSAGYHGYWGLDFTTIDPHFGTEQDFRDLVAAAHDRGMKVYLDIVVNHTADVIGFQEGFGYESLATKPYKAIDGGVFNLEQVTGLPSCATSGQIGCFPLLSAATSFPKTIYANENDLKQPAFLQDVTNYHNRGNIIDWNGEQMMLGDFFGLDDVFTEREEVVSGWAEVWADWVIDFGVDGFRIDTAKHVDPAFFNRWAPQVYQRVAAAGLATPDMFGEIFSSDLVDLSDRVRNQGLQSVLDFAVDEGVTGFAATGYLGQLAGALAADDLFNRGAAPGLPVANAYSLVTFAGNHDEGRLARQLLRNNFGLKGAKLLDRVRLAYAMLFTMRGAPTLYYGDEIGMIGAGGDKEARLDMFPTAISWWRDQERVGSGPIGTASGLGITSHPVMDHITALGQLRAAHPALRTGASLPRKATVQLPSQAGKACKVKNKVLRLPAAAWELVCRQKQGKLVWAARDVNQVAAWSRFDAAARTEYVVVANAADGARTVRIQTSTPGAAFSPVFGAGAAATADSAGGVRLTVPARSLLVVRAGAPLPAVGAPTVAVKAALNEYHSTVQLSATVTVGGKATLDPATVTFVAWDPAAADWFILGSDDAASYRLFLADWAKQGRQSLLIAAVVRTTDGQVAFSEPTTVSF